MKTRLAFSFAVSCAALIWFAAGYGQAAPPAQQQPSLAETAALINQYCVTCHNNQTRTANLSLENLDPARAGDNLDYSGHPDVRNQTQMWERVIRKMRSGLMPPPGARRPEWDAQLNAARALEQTIDRASRPRLAPIGIHRLNRTEYGNAIRDLLALEIDPSTHLPVDNAGFGFDNMAASMTMTAGDVEAFVAAAAKISRLAIGSETEPTKKRYAAPSDHSQNGHIEGLPFGTRGGLLARHYVPADGEYKINVYPVRTNTYGLFGSTRAPLETLIIVVDGARVAEIDFKKVAAMGSTYDEDHHAIVALKAGVHEIGAAFLNKSLMPHSDLNQWFERSILDTGNVPGFSFFPHLSSLEILGPMKGARPTDSQSRKKIFTCTPANTQQEASCAQQILSQLARRAYRRPVTAEEIESLTTFYDEGRKEGTFEDGIEFALQRILSDPRFIYRVEVEPANVAAGTVYDISDLELASRLSYFLWSSGPDDTLIDLASRNQLRQPQVLRQQVTRMLQDPKSEQLIKNFGGQWLGLRLLPSKVPAEHGFPNFDNNLRDAFRTEVELFFGSIVQEDRSILDLLNADYTFVNERLARHYGIPNVYGGHFRRIALGDRFEARRGVFGKGAILLATALANRNSPVERGKWVLASILGVQPPDPPPNVPELKTNNQNSNGRVGAALDSIRGLMEQHRANPACASCHRLMDPFGFALENFDATGEWRDFEAGSPINATATLPDGRDINGPVELRNALTTRYSDLFVTVATEKLLTYALGRGVEYADMATVRRIVRDAAANNYSFSSLLMGVVTSDPFRKNVKIGG